MKIAIIGGGISGLSLYLFLQKYLEEHNDLKSAVEITILEPHSLPRLHGRQPDDIPSTGGGYGLAHNGMASLRRLDPALHEQILRNGFPTSKFVMKSARGWTLGAMPFTDLRGNEPDCCVMVLREILIAALYERIPTTSVIQRKVVRAEDGPEHATVELDNGEVCRYDLVIGADGVWRWVSTDFLPPPPETGPAAHGQTVMTFGPNGFFAYTPYTTGDTPATKKHIEGEATLPPGKNAFWWSRSAQEQPSANPDAAVLKQELEKRHSSWKDPTIMEIIRHSEVALKTPTFVSPKAPTWAGKRVVLIGDAAHALPSSSGQGVSQCLEDAEALASLLVFNLQRFTKPESELEILSNTFKQYMQVRKAHVEKVLDAGNRAGDSSREMGLILEMLMYAMMWAMLKFFGTFFLKTVLNYDLHAEIEKAKKSRSM
ncbi:uncharacterized protein LTR77_003701 [Saxophila tyrrhenica]|uniref:FAD-binding domain-containing protein n=1 Tax=Saxophila tyrrhenica TaxID=1690608 RepID=A0AAV9PHW0_9PEZI|nr:hypothetical protein LTR77_003701 [Saxophila tyrrhenica]